MGRRGHLRVLRSPTSETADADRVVPMPATTDPANLAAVFKAYDVRGTVPDQVDESLARATGNAFVTVTGGAAEGSVAVGHDMRPSSPGMAAAFAEGAAEARADVVLIGLASTDQALLRVGQARRPRARCSPRATTPRSTTGSRCAAPTWCPSACRPGWRRSATWSPRASAPWPRDGGRSRVRRAGRPRRPPAHLAPVHGRRLTVAVDAGNGMAGHTTPAVFEKARRRPGADVLRNRRRASRTTRQTIPSPENLRDLQARVAETGADIGLAFDGDADRAFLVDKRGGRSTPRSSPPSSRPARVARGPGRR